jgi:hypothetical protein
MHGTYNVKFTLSGLNVKFLPVKPDIA